ncbi:hypothetical protein ECANGB1_772 [Enterospora canceri]|uniref:Uncharacterized protein n=1 Tax=Enterospora canceri TaxID=1081671 RepID=A0A1Y1S486_9MICR|nr:hypothetical protein ECANGB1_772 [Enterospora canceri]
MLVNIFFGSYGCIQMIEKFYNLDNRAPYTFVKGSMDSFVLHNVLIKDTKISSLCVHWCDDEKPMETGIHRFPPENSDPQTVLKGEIDNLFDPDYCPDEEIEVRELLLLQSEEDFDDTKKRTIAELEKTDYRNNFSDLPRQIWYQIYLYIRELKSEFCNLSIDDRKKAIVKVNQHESASILAHYKTF